MITTQYGRTARQPHPVLDVLGHEGRTIAGVARMTGFTRTYLSLVFNGREPATQPVREACAKALGRPESELFHVTPADAANATPAAVA